MTANSTPANIVKPGIVTLPVIFVALCNFLVTFDITAIVVAMPTIRTEMGLGVSGFAWVMDSYSLAFASLLMGAGAFADRFGQRRVLLIGMAIFFGGSLFCAAASAPAPLFAGRILQGVGAAFVICGGLSLLTTLHPDRSERIRAFAFAGAVAGAAMALGPAIGGLLTDFIGWRWVFWINIPLCIGIAFGILSSVKPDEVKEGSEGRVDVAGVVTLTLFLAVTIWVLLHGANIGGYEFPLIVGVAAPIVLLGLFVLSQFLQDNPIFGLSLFRTRKFVGMCAVPIGLSLGYWAMLVYLPLYMRDGLDLSTSEISIYMLAMTLPMVFLPFVGGKIAVRIGEKAFFVLGLLGLAAGCILIAFGAGRADLVLSAFGMLLAGVSAATVNAQVSGAIVAMVPSEKAGTASAIATTLRQGGFALGIALLGATLRKSAPTAEVGLEAIRFLPVFLTAAVGSVLCALLVFVLVRVQQPSQPD